MKVKQIKTKLNDFIKKISTSFLSSFVTRLERVIHSLKGKDLTEDSFEPLTPSNDVDPDGVYSKALDWSLQKEDIKNVALSGAYGSGKSSILKTFEKKFESKYNFLNISLLTTQTEKSTGDESVNSLEKSILQQMFYKVQDKRIPYTRFKRIRNIKDRSFFYFLFFLSLFLFCGLELFKPGFLKDLISNTIFEVKVSNQELYKSILVSYSIIYLFLLLQRFYKIIYKNLRLSKITMQNTTLEVVADNSVFSKYIDEIIYFFEATKYNVVIFEDLDRFNNLEIFENLRELNSLINNSEKINRKVTFIYAVKDDMFGQDDSLQTSRNRTKFFDFIVPVVPIINSSNSGEVLKTKLRKNSFGVDISDEFINDITIFIDDMRILKNIYNEYILYKDNLSKLKLNPNKLLAMIVYKNIYPSDFTKLQFNEGMVFNALSKKSTLIQKQIDKLNQNILDIENQINSAENETITSIEDLQAAYGVALFGYHTNVQIILDSSRSYNSLQESSALFTNLINAKDINVLRNGNWSYSHKREDIATVFNTRDNYYDRAQAIENKIEKRINDLKVELNKLKEIKEEVNLWSLVDLIQQSRFEEIFEGDIKKEKLLVFLFRNGYIDETYHQYTTYFYPGSLTVDDMTFIMSVKNQEELPFNYKLNKLTQVIGRLYANDFKRPEILNIMLVNHVISASSGYSNYLKIILTQLANETERSVRFIDIFKRNSPHKEEFIKQLCMEWPSIWKYVERTSNYPEAKKEEYLVDILYSASLNDITLINQENILKNYIENKSNFLSLLHDESKDKRIQRIVSDLQVRFRDLSYSVEKVHILKNIYLNNHYEINRTMIDLFLRSFHGLPKEDTHNYSHILSSNCQELIEYVNDNINLYIENVYLSQEAIREEEDVFLKLLNNRELDNSLKKELIIKQESILTDLGAFEATELWPDVLLNNKIKPTWENIITYLSEDEDVHEIDDAVISFLNRIENSDELSKDQLSDLLLETGDIPLEKLSELLIKTLGINEESFKKIARSLLRFTYYQLDDLPLKRIEILINSHVLYLSPENYSEIKQKNPNQDLNILIIEKHPQKFLDNQTEYSLSPNEIVKLLRSKSFDVDQKWRLIEGLSVEDIPSSLELADAISKFALEYDKEIDRVIFNYILESSVSIDQKIKLFIKLINDTELGIEEIVQILIYLESPYSEITERKRPVFEDSVLNRNLLDTLVQKDLVSSWKEEKSGLRVNTKQRMSG